MVKPPLGLDAKPLDESIESHWPGPDGHLLYGLIDVPYDLSIVPK
jgi:hypothetical protein